MSRQFILSGMAIEAQALPPGLHIVATPIGNLGDMTIRGLATLAAADAVLAEDTRVTRILLAHYGITTPLIAYHEHNASEMGPRLVGRLAAGERLALVSDAGTPLLSDPGEKLVGAAISAGISVISAPGASALLAALVSAGLPADRFFFEGFLPAKAGERRRRIRELAAIPATLVFYEAPHRAAEALADLASVLGERQAVLARELTKRFETIRRGTLASLAGELANEPAPKGEIVLLAGPPVGTGEITDDAIDAAIVDALQRHSQRDAVQIVASELGLPRRRVYARSLRLSAADPAERPAGDDDA